MMSNQHNLFLYRNFVSIVAGYEVIIFLIKIISAII